MRMTEEFEKNSDLSKLQQKRRKEIIGFTVVQQPEESNPEKRTENKCTITRETKEA